MNIFILKNYCFVLAAACVLHACTPTPTNQPPNAPLNILCTTGMIADVVQNIGGSHAQITALMGAGTDPHLYKATQGDLSKMRNADVIFYNGLHLEGKMVEIFEKLKRTKTTISVGDALPKNMLIANDNFGSNYDPHIWFSIKNWQAVAQIVASTLKKKDAKNAANYQKNLDNYLLQLQTLDIEIASRINKTPPAKRILITSHDAFEYFGRDFNIKVRALQGISTVAEYGLKDITDLVNFVVANKISTVFIESSVSARSIEAVVAGCAQKGHTVRIGGTLYSDAMGATNTPEGTYIGMLRHNANAIAGGWR